MYFLRGALGTNLHIIILEQLIYKRVDKRAFSGNLGDETNGIYAKITFFICRY